MAVQAKRHARRIGVTPQKKRIAPSLLHDEPARAQNVVARQAVQRPPDQRPFGRRTNLLGRLEVIGVVHHAAQAGIRVAAVAVGPRRRLKQPRPIQRPIGLFGMACIAQFFTPVGIDSFPRCLPLRLQRAGRLRRAVGRAGHALRRCHCAYQPKREQAIACGKLYRSTGDVHGPKTPD